MKRGGPGARAAASTAAGILLALTVTKVAAQPAQESQPQVDRRTGLVMVEGFETVRKECTSCHSTSFIVQNRGRREDWLGMIRWMQETQKLRRFDAATEKVILDYLSRNYGLEEKSMRRRPLPPELLPPPV